MFNSILLAVDGSDHSIRATREAIKIAKCSLETSVTVIYVADYTDAKTEVLHSGSSIELDMKRRKKAQPIEDLLKTNHITYNFNILHGTPGPTIVEYANNGEFDMLIIGSRGLNSLQEMVLGSVSHKVIKRADCPVLIVK